MNEILWRVDERMRPSLEVKFATQTWEIEKEILREFGNIVNGKAAIVEQFRNMNFSITESIVNKSLQYMAKTGELPTDEVLQNIKKQESCIKMDLNQENNIISIETHKDKVLSKQNSLDIT